jgi:hypothetical protein
MDVELLRKLRNCAIAFDGRNGHFRLESRCIRRGRRFMLSPDSQAPACLRSGRNSTYRPVQNSGTTSLVRCEKTCKQNLHLPAKQIGQCWGRATVGHVNHIYSGYHLEQLTFHMAEVRWRTPY